MAQQALTVRLRGEGVRETLYAFRQLPKDASSELRSASRDIAGVLARSARQASTVDNQAAAVGKTVRVIRDRVPVVQAGGNRKVTSTGARAYDLLFGSEFGMNRKSGWYAHPRYRGETATQFATRHRGQDGRWFFPSVEREFPAVLAQWRQAADAIVRRFGEGG